KTLQLRLRTDYTEAAGSSQNQASIMVATSLAQPYRQAFLLTTREHSWPIFPNIWRSQSTPPVTPSNRSRNWPNQWAAPSMPWSIASAEDENYSSAAMAGARQMGRIS